MRRTFGAWRRTSSAPMNTSQGRPSSARAGGGRDAVLAGAGLGDHARLAHALGEQDLAEHVVHLVRAGVAQVLALEPDRVADLARQVLARGRAASAGRRSPRAAACARASNAGSRARVVEGALELVERGHQRLGDVAPAERTVVGGEFAHGHERLALGHSAGFGKARGLPRLRCGRGFEDNPGLHMAKIDLVRLRGIGLALSVLAAAAWVFTRFTAAQPLSDWFLPRLLFALFWAWLWAAGCWLSGERILDWLVPGRELDGRAVHAFAIGVVLFSLLIFATGLLGLWGGACFVVLPCAQLALGRARYVRRLGDRLKSELHGSALELLGVAAGAVALAVLLVISLPADNLSFDARLVSPRARRAVRRPRWRRALPRGAGGGHRQPPRHVAVHLGAAHAMGRAGDRVLLARQIELVMIAFTLLGLPALARALCPGPGASGSPGSASSCSLRSSSTTPRRSARRTTSRPSSPCRCGWRCSHSYAAGTCERARCSPLPPRGCSRASIPR